MILWTNTIRRKFVDKTFSDWLMLSSVKVIALERHLVFIILKNIFNNSKDIIFFYLFRRGEFFESFSEIYLLNE